MRRKLPVEMIDKDERFIYEGNEWKFVNMDFSSKHLNLESFSHWDFEQLYVAMNLSNGIIVEFAPDTMVEQDEWI